jgi:hypothetical protein
VAQDQRLGDLAVAPAGGDQGQHLGLAPGEAARERRPSPQGPGGGDVEGGAEALEHRSGRVQLQGGGVLVAKGLVGAGQQQPHPGGVVRHVQLLPAPAGCPQGRQGRLGAPAGEQDRPPGLEGGRLQARAAGGRGRPLQLVAGDPGGPGVAGGQGDLDLGGAQPGPGQPVVDHRGPGVRTEAAAAAARPWARRSRARPGWGSRPSRWASR